MRDHSPIPEALLQNRNHLSESRARLGSFTTGPPRNTEGTPKQILNPNKRRQQRSRFTRRRALRNGKVSGCSTKVNFTSANL